MLRFGRATRLYRLSLREIRCASKLLQPIRHDIAAYIGKAKFSALVFEGEAFMIQAQQTQYRSVQVMHMDGLLGNTKTKFICLSIG